jgi:hypothetical protein
MPVVPAPGGLQPTPAMRRLRTLAATVRPRPCSATLATPPLPLPLPTEEVAAVQMSEQEKFLWDLQGFLVVPQMLTRTETARLNGAFDAMWDARGDCHQTPAYDEFTGMLTWPHPHCEPFRELLAHPKLIPYMNSLFGRGWKLDHHPFMITGDVRTKLSKTGFGAGSPGGGRMHGSTRHQFNGSQYYRYANGEMHNGMVVAAFQLRDVKKGDGGLGLIPGSHKANFKMPVHISTSSLDSIQAPVYNVPAKAGDLILFSEASIHGTLPVSTLASTPVSF